jgi:DNA-binding response OmpR family regulator
MMRSKPTACNGAPAGDYPLAHALPASRILVVDDELAIRLWVAQVLAGSGYQVETAEDGQAGWEALQAKDYDLLITDNNMPKISGVEIVKMLRSQGMALPVILASGAMPTQELTRHPWLQVDATLQKPFAGKQLLQTVRTVLRQADGPGLNLRPRQSGEATAAAPGWQRDDLNSRPGAVLSNQASNFKHRGNPQ